MVHSADGRPVPVRAAGPGARVPRVGSREMDDRVAVARARGIDVLSLHGGPSLPLPDHIREAAIEAMSGPGVRSSRGLPELRAAIATALGSESADPIDPEREIAVAHGAMQALNLVLRAVLAPGDRVVVPAPNFFFDGMVRLTGAEPVFVPSVPGDGWRWDLDALIAAIDDSVRAVVISNPTNPTGYLPSAAELEAVHDAARAVGAVLVSDESYDRLIYPEGTFTTLAALPRTDTTVLVRSLSKSYALVDWRVGYVVAAPDLIDQVVNLIEWECLHCGYPAQRVATAAIAGPQEWILDAHADYLPIRDRLLAAVEQSDWIATHRPLSTPFLFLDASRLVAAGVERPEERLLDWGVPTVAGHCFQAPSHFLRLPIGCDDSTAARLGQALQEVAPT
jgi:aspartate/methionine/tyrosine aminotransferase